MAESARSPTSDLPLQQTAAQQKEAMVALISKEILEHAYIRYDKGTLGVNRGSITYGLELAGGNRGLGGVRFSAYSIYRVIYAFVHVVVYD